MREVSVELDIIPLSPPGLVCPALARACAGGGLAGGAALEASNLQDTRQIIDVLIEAGEPFSISTGPLTPDSRTLIRTAARAGLNRVILCNPDPSCLADDIRLLQAAGLVVLVEVTASDQAETAQCCRADGIVVKGHESGGRIGEQTTFILLQGLAAKVSLPVWARGGVGEYTASACLAAGAAGVVLDWQLAMCEESDLPDDAKAHIRRMDGSETVVLGQDCPVRYRVHQRHGESVVAALKDYEESSGIDADSDPDGLQAWENTVEAAVRGEGSNVRPLLTGQDAAFAAPLAARHRNVAGVCHALRRAAKRQCAIAARDRPLRPQGPMAEAHGTAYPIVQGPMTRVSDTADFALAVADAGALPFVALSLLSGPEVGLLLEETKAMLGNKPWGVGILGFLPRELREEQLAELRKHRPAFALIAGGHSEQANALEGQGIHTYLHIPSPGLLKMSLRSGVRRLVFEGRECGGHVGPRTSLVLWESMIRVILDHLSATQDRGDNYDALFAGGIHDALSASMVAALAAPLTEAGVRVGVLMGTAYLFCREAVDTGAIVKGFQQAAIACEHTALLQTSLGHATRCADTPFAKQFRKKKRSLIAEGRSREEIGRVLDGLNLGRLRIASKAIVRGEGVSEETGSEYASVAEETQQGEGLYMIGQVAALRSTECTMSELHEDVSLGGTELVERFATEARVGSDRKACDVAIVGMSCAFPKAADLDGYWQNILDRVNAITEIPHDRWDAELYFNDDRRARDKVYSRWGGFLDEIPFDPMRYGMPPNSVRSVEPTHLAVLELVRQALEDAGYADRQFDREHTSVVLGAGGGVGDVGLGYGFRSMLPHYLTRAGLTESEAAEIIDRLEGHLPEWTEDSFAGLLLNVTAGRVANRFDLGGTNYTVDAACASSLAAVRLAVNELSSGSSNMVIVGGADMMQSPFAYLCFSKTQALSPTGQCRTFDGSADGIVISEGVAIAVLKRLEDAERDGDRVYAVIKGVGSSSDGKEKALTAPHPAGQMRALQRAYAQAGFTPASVGLVEAHGTGTVVGDRSEVESLSRVFEAAGASEQSCAIGSVKSMIGHTKCAAGIAGLVKAALALHHRVLPPTIGVTKPNPDADFPRSSFYVNSEARPWIKRTDDTPRRAGVSAFGFGGTNFHAVLEEYDGPNHADETETPLRRGWPAELFIWHGSSPQAILRSIDQVTRAIKEGAEPALGDLAAAVCHLHGNGVGDFRLAIVANSLEDLLSKLVVATETLQQGSGDLSNSRNVYYSSAPLSAQGRIAFAFPGQGSQTVNMLRDLALTFPVVRRVFEEADRSLDTLLGQPLSQYVFPRPRFTDEDRAADDAALTQTNIAQPAMGAADMAMYALLSELGIRAECFFGHSYGEYVALYAAGVVGSADLMRVSAARGRLIAEAAKMNPGTMAAVRADEETVARVLRDVAGVSIANLNGPSQTVISGTKAAVDECVKRFRSEGVSARAINVSCAFHSDLVAGAKEPFARFLDDVEFAAPLGPVYSNTLAARHASNPADIKATLVDHLVQPVRFAGEVMAMYEDGLRIFVEVGPGKTLTSLIEQTLGDRPFVAVSMDGPGPRALQCFLQGLAQLAVAGVKFNTGRLFKGRVEESLDLNRLLADSKPAPLSPTTWMISGARSVPIKDHGKTPAATPGKVDGKATTSRPSTCGGAASEEASPFKTPLDVGDDPGQQSGLATLGDGAGQSTDGKRNISPPPDGRSDIPAAATGQTGTAREPSTPARMSSSPLVEETVSGNGQPDGLDSVMVAHQQLMTAFLETHKKVMLDYLQRDGHPAANSPAPAVSAKGSVKQAGSIEPSDVSVDSTLPASATPDSGEDSTTSDWSTTGGASRAPLSTHDSVDEPGVVDGAPSPSPVTCREELVQGLLEVVAERTGYPTDMLDLDLDLEADLGIDSIKWLEILGMLQQTALLPGEFGEGEIETLSKLRTLRAIADFIEQRAAGTEQSPGPVSDHATDTSDKGDLPAGVDEPSPRETPEHHGIPRMVLEAVECPIGDGDTGIAISGTVLITDDHGGVAAALADRLREAGIQPVVVSAARHGATNGRQGQVNLSDPAAVREFIAQTRNQHGQIGAVVHLLPLSEDHGAGRDDPANWQAVLRIGLASLLNLVQELESDLNENGSGCVIAATRMGGHFGSLGNGNAEHFRPGQGGVCGFVKTLAREWPQVRCKALDFERDTAADDIAKAITAELVTRDASAEIGYLAGRRTHLRTVRSSLAHLQPEQITLDADSVLLITGGACGISAEVAKELAERYRCTLALVGRSPMPCEQEPPETAPLSTPKELKSVLRDGIDRSGQRATPANIEYAYRRLLREREIRNSLGEMRKAGAKVEYHSVDVTDPTAFGGLIDDLYTRHGRLDGVIHGAGVIEDKLIVDKTLESFERVLAPKVTGAFVLASKLRPESLKFVMFFSSVTARYGNRGQCDYAAANEVLNKLAVWLNDRWPCRVASLNWGPWESSGGMVSQDLARRLAEAGIHVIKRPEGRKAFVAELLYGPKEAAEVIFGGPLDGVSAISKTHSDVATDHSRTAPLLAAPAETIRHSSGAIELRRTLDPSRDHYLLDHQLDNKPVMPMAMMLELFAEVAALARPDLHFAGVRRLRILRGITLDNSQRRTCIVASPGEEVDGGVDITLTAKCSDAPEICYTATAELRGKLPQPPEDTAFEPANRRTLPLSVPEAYEQWLFHGPIFAGIKEIDALGDDGIIARLSPSSPQDCLAGASGQSWLVDPVVIDSGLQLLILWARTYLDMTPLPSQLGRYRSYGRRWEGEVRCEARIKPTAGGLTLHTDLRFFNEVGQLIGRLEGMDVTCSKALNRLAGSAGHTD